MQFKKIDLQYLVKVSRPRFWLYLLGPYLVGAALAVNSREELVSQLNIVIPHILLFSIVANLYLYGINDLFDWDTDEHNDQKKSGYETRAVSSKKKLLRLSVIGSASVVLIFIFLQGDRVSSILLSIFFLLSTFYSMPPIRFKARPIVDSISNFLYAMPGVFAFQQISEVIPPAELLFAVGCWTAAMHLFSAIPDIEPDKKAGLKTTAVILGEKPSLLLCFVLWSMFLLIIATHINYLSILALLIYLLLPLILLFSRSELIFKIYKAFPIINALIGFAAFLYFALPKLLL